MRLQLLQLHELTNPVRLDGTPPDASYDRVLR